jgi:hypothetical protein
VSARAISSGNLPSEIIDPAPSRNRQRVSVQNLDGLLNSARVGIPRFFSPRQSLAVGEKDHGDNAAGVVPFFDQALVCGVEGGDRIVDREDLVGLGRAEPVGDPLGGLDRDRALSLPEIAVVGDVAEVPLGGGPGVAEIAVAEVQGGLAVGEGLAAVVVISCLRSVMVALAIASAAR